MEIEQLIHQAKEVLEANYNGTFTKPAPSLYPHHWNWDTAFIALGLAHYDWDRAVAEIRHIFAGQWKNGMLPHIVFGEDPSNGYFPAADFWQTAEAENAPKNPETSGITQPPVFGFIVKKIYDLAEDKEKGLAFLKEMFPKIQALHRYLYTYRDPLEEGLVYIRHPWESGTDNSPTWDEALSKIDTSKIDLPPYQRKDLKNPQSAAHRPTDLDYDKYVHLVDVFRKNKYEETEIEAQSPFKIQDPLFNSLLVWSNECLMEIGDLIKEDINDIFLWNELTIHSMNEKLWDEEVGIYNAYDLVNKKVILGETNSGLLPILADIPSLEQAELILRNLEDEYFSGTEENPMYLCPTYDTTAEDFSTEKYWRGPVWINTNWLLYQGLLRFDMTTMANRVRKESLELIEKNGFYEYFDPRKNLPEGAKAGYGTSQFSWSAALCLDFLLSEK